MQESKARTQRSPPNPRSTGKGPAWLIARKIGKVKYASAGSSNNVKDTLSLCKCFYLILFIFPKTKKEHTKKEKELKAEIGS